MHRLFLLTVLLLTAFCAHSQEFSNTTDIDHYLEKQMKRKKIAGAVVLVQKDGRTLLHKAYGDQNIEENVSMDTSSIFRIYSMTKPLTTLAAMMLVDRDSIGLDDPIVNFLPELNGINVANGEPLKRAITVRDLMRHTSGFVYGFGLGFSKVDLLYGKKHPLLASTGDEMIQRLSEYPVKSQPGEEYNYSLSVDVLGVIIERVSGQSLGDFMAENIFRPLGMNDSHFVVPEEKVDRFCSMYGMGLFLKESPKSSEYTENRFEQGGGGLVSTSADYLKFCDLMRHQGIMHGDTLIHPALIAEMVKNQLPEDQGVSKHNGEVAVGFGLGFSVQLQEWGKYGHLGDYGWSGIGGTHFVISPKENATIIILTQKQPFTDRIKRGLLPIIYEGF